MKAKIFVSLIFLFLSSVSFSQTDAKKGQSKADEFSSKAGRLVKKEYTDIDNFKSCAFKIETITDLVTNEKISALRIEKEVSGTYTTTTKIAMLDVDEIDGFLKSLKIIKDLLSTLPSVYTEIIFTCRGGFESGAYYDVEKAKWSIYLKLEEFDSDSYVFMKSDDLDLLITVVEKAKSSITK